MPAALPPGRTRAGLSIPWGARPRPSERAAPEEGAGPKSTEKDSARCKRRTAAWAASVPEDGFAAALETFEPRAFRLCEAGVLPFAIAQRRQLRKEQVNKST